MNVFVRLRSTRLKFRQKLKRHSHLLVFFGALIVFATFVIKEGARDSWKEEVGALETAHYIYGLRAQSNTEQDQKELLSVGGRIQKLRADESRSAMDKYLAAMSLDESIRQATEHAERKVDALEIIGSKLPEKNKARVRIEEESRELSGIVVDGSSIGLTDNDVISVSAIKVYLDENNKSSANDVVNSKLNDQQTIVTSLLTLQTDVEGDRLDLENAANKELAHYQTMSSIAWWGTAVFFCLGWGLGLLGKLYGVPEAASGE